MVGATFVLVVVAGIAGSIPFLGLLSSLLLTGVFYGGLYLYYLKTIRGQPAEFGDVFSGFSLAFVPLMLATLVSTVLTGLGCVLHAWRHVRHEPVLRLHADHGWCPGRPYGRLAAWSARRHSGRGRLLRLQDEGHARCR